MASLMEELLSTLEAEKEIYEKLIPVSESKMRILVREDLEELKKVTSQEQLLIDRVAAIDRRRERVIENIGIVLNKAPKDMDLTTLAHLLTKQPEERRKVEELHDSLRTIMKQLIDVNEKNKKLIENSLEMIEFNMNFIQSTRMSPGVNNYDSKATTMYTDNYGGGGFDAKQ